MQSPLKPPALPDPQPPTIKRASLFEYEPKLDVFAGTADAYTQPVGDRSVSAQPETTLTLKGDATLPRELWLRMGSTPNFVASVYGRKKVHVIPPRTLAFAWGPIAECRLESSRTGWTLWVGNAAFDVTESEAAQIHAAFAPLALKSAFTP